MELKDETKLRDTGSWEQYCIRVGIWRKGTMFVSALLWPSWVEPTIHGFAPPPQHSTAAGGAPHCTVEEPAPVGGGLQLITSDISSFIDLSLTHQQHQHAHQTTKGCKVVGVLKEVIIFEKLDYAERNVPQCHPVSHTRWGWEPPSCSSAGWFPPRFPQNPSTAAYYGFSIG